MRFTLSRHDRPGDPHFDLFLESETGGPLMTWNLSAIPDFVDPAPARSIADHRAVYLEFEGEISEGRGTVTIVDTGDCAWLERTDERIRVRLSGRRLNGIIELTRQSGDVWQVRHGIDSSPRNPRDPGNPACPNAPSGV